MSLIESVADLFGLDHERYAWRAYGACRLPENRHLNFFPGRGDSTAAQKRVCASCPVKDPCLQAALRNNERDGIWGGTTENDRKRLRRQQTPRVDVHAAMVETIRERGGSFDGGVDDPAALIGCTPEAITRNVRDDPATFSVDTGPRGRIVAIHLNEGDPSCD